MGPVRIVLGVEDEQYIELFLDYIRCSEYSRRARIQAFSRIDDFVEHLNMGDSGKAAVILAELPFLTELSQSGQPGNAVYCLSEHGREDYAGQVLMKYQPLNELLDAVLKGRPESGGTLREGGRSQARVIAVYSAAGGSGKSTVAQQLVKLLGTEGMKVFYLNLETFQGTSGNRTAGGGLEQLLYDLKAASEQQAYPDQPVSHYASESSALNADIFAPVENINELLEMDQADTLRLIDYIADSGEYELLAIDLDSYPNERTKAALERCDRIVWLLTDDIAVLCKEALCMSQLEKEQLSLTKPMNKTLFVLNRYLGTFLNQTLGLEVIPELTLAYIPEWKQCTQSHELRNSSAFQRDLLKLRRALLSGSSFGLKEQEEI
ncbi:hypothetical protein DCC85_06090 [Paenibacillus sp. CAA11]|uniref:hypothetical protein n=1 Tax=Paenibacillus sp. CAA11 TaxID=1532905 RepID=UPI000D38F137|nr:hypothetical protein [Paenibacillus sp. CAA11]AWB43833.1 hypothetical protein DCC85_06090 [Paenibacillus sp. CAA11]